jgi:hypothetical protein
MKKRVFRTNNRDGFAPMYFNRVFLVTFVKCFRAGLVWGK